jgi:proline iminopeptidase
MPLSVFRLSWLGALILLPHATNLHEPLDGQRAQTGAAPPSDTGHVLTSDGTHLFYEVVGTGPQTVIIPGRLFLIRALRPLAIERRLIFYDTRSRGLSDAVRDSARESIEDDVQDLEAIRTHFAADRAMLVGYSYMGLLVMLYARAHPAHVERIVQLDPVPPNADMTFPGLSEDYKSALDSAGVAQLAALRRAGFDSTSPEEYCRIDWRVNRRALVGNPAHVNRLANADSGLCRFRNEWPVYLDRHINASFASIQRIRVRAADFARVTMPVLTVHGTRDRNAPYGGGRTWAMSLPNARLLTVEGGAHQSFDEYPDVVLPAVRTFLRGAWPATAVKVTTLVPKRARGLAGMADAFSGR